MWQSICLTYSTPSGVRTRPMLDAIIRNGVNYMSPLNKRGNYKLSVRDGIDCHIRPPLRVVEALTSACRVVSRKQGLGANQWIPVIEGEPDGGTGQYECLICNERIQICDRIKPLSGYDFWSNDTFCTFGVTHWRPLSNEH